MQPDLLQPIEQDISDRSILKHPFYQAWQRGELTMPALQDYAVQYYQHVAAFPTYLSALHSHTQDLATRQVILENLIDEERGAENHPELWLRFAESLGLSREQPLCARVEPETRAMIDTFRTLCREGSVAEGLAALYAYESQVPAVAETKIRGLKEHYGISSEAGLSYFTVHQAADIVHSRQQRVLLARHLDRANSARARQAAQQALDSLWDLLFGVCKRHSILCGTQAAQALS